MKNKKYTFYTFLGILLVCKFVYWLFTFPNPDEAYYWLWGRFPALSYHDHPALQALIQGMFYKIFGKSLFVLRLPVFICLMICTLIYYRLLKRMNQSVDIPLVMLTFFSIPLFFIFTSFAWHDYMMITMILSSGYFWLNYLTDKWDGKNGKSKDIFLAFTFLGMAALSKYNSVFVAFAMASVVIINKPLRSVLKDVRIYLGIILCLFIIAPIFIWNIQNQYGSFKFTLGQRTLDPLLKGNFFSGNIAGFIIGSIALITPFTWWFLIRNRKYIQQSKRNAYSSYEIVYRKIAKHLFLWSSLTFLCLSTFSNVLYYWNIPAYIFILPLWIVLLLKIKKEKLNAILVYSAIVNVLIVIHFSVLPLNSFIDGVEDKDGALYYGWPSIGNKIETLINENPKELQILTTSYRTASLLSFQLDRSDIYSYSPRFDQFDYWTNKLTYDKQDAIILSDDWQPINGELKEVVENISIVDTIHIKRFGFKIKDYYIYKASIRDKYLKIANKK